MDAEDVVRAFVARLAELTAEVGRAMADRTGGDDLWALCTAVNQRRAPRKWQLASGVYYAVHGVGCLITAPDRAEIDVDLGPQLPMLQFDAWRVWNFAESIGEKAVGQGDLASALERLAAEGTVAAVDPARGWYTAARTP